MNDERLYSEQEISRIFTRYARHQANTMEHPLSRLESALAPGQTEEAVHILRRP